MLRLRSSLAEIEVLKMDLMRRQASCTQYTLEGRCHSRRTTHIDILLNDAARARPLNILNREFSLKAGIQVFFYPRGKRLAPMDSLTSEKRCETDGSLLTRRLRLVRGERLWSQSQNAPEQLLAARPRSP